jgi:hypothetical protein
MTRHSVALLASVAVAIPNVCFAQGNALRACVDIYKGSTRDYSQAQQTNIELARSYSSFCKKDGSVNTSATGVGLEAIVEEIPFKFSFSNSSSQQKMEEFCKVGSSQYESWNSGSSASSTVVTDALSNFNSCVQLANSGLQLDVSINQPNTLVINGSASAAYSGFISRLCCINSLERSSPASWQAIKRRLGRSGSQSEFHCAPLPCT